MTVLPSKHESRIQIKTETQARTHTRNPEARVSVGDLLRVKYLDHLLFINQDPTLYRQPPILDTTGRVTYQDDKVIMLTWETFKIPTQEGSKLRASGVTIHRATIVEMRKL